RPFNPGTRLASDDAEVCSYPLGIHCPTCSTGLRHSIAFMHKLFEEPGKIEKASTGRAIDWAIIIERDVYVPVSAQCYRCIPSSKYGSLAMSPAAVIEIRKYQDGVIYATHRGIVGIRLYHRYGPGEEDRQHYLISTNPARGNGKTFTVTYALHVAKRLAASQKWCIG
ncbi:hypothetical protein CC86DRAFT_425383, partial [Ophiobolus disseminans]